MKIGFCISGGGRVAESILAARAAGLLKFGRAMALVDRRGPFIEAVRSYDVETIVIDCRRHRDNLGTFQTDLEEHLLAWDVDALFLTFNWILSQRVISRFGTRTVNLHMSLLPLFPGMGAIQKVAASGTRVAGITYHRIDAGVDTGPIIAQAVHSSSGMTATELGRALFRRAVPLGIQVVRWLETDALGTGPCGRVEIEGASFDDGPYFPCVDADIIEFSRTFLAQRYP